MKLPVDLSLETRGLIKYIAHLDALPELDGEQISLAIGTINCIWLSAETDGTQFS